MYLASTCLAAVPSQKKMGSSFSAGFGGGAGPVKNKEEDPPPPPPRRKVAAAPRPPAPKKRRRDAPPPTSPAAGSAAIYARMRPPSDRGGKCPSKWVPGGVERYYCGLEVKLPQQPDSAAPQLLLLNANGLGVVCLSPWHPLAQPGAVKRVEWCIKQTAQLSGRKKSGAAQLTYDTPLCSFELADGSTSSAMACVHGDLIELNQRLVEEPELLSSEPTWSGFLAIVRPYSVNEFQQFINQGAGGDEDQQGED